MSVGLEAAGFDVVAAVEIDAIHCLVHHFNFPYSATICSDIRSLSSHDLLEAAGIDPAKDELDLIAGGPPCQGFSHIGKRKIDDPRNSLVFEYFRVVRDLRPKYFLFENVPGIASGEHKKFLSELIGEFESIGYHLASPVQILDASHFGGPQRRRRLILIGSRADARRARYPIPVSIQRRDSDTDLFGSATITSVADAIGDLSLIPVFEAEDCGIGTSSLDYSGFRANFAMESSGLFGLCHRRKSGPYVWGHVGSKHTAESVRRFAMTTPGTVEPISRFFKLDPDGLCNTIRAGTNSDKGAFTAPRPIHYSVPRCISIREAARLHTFPDWFRFHSTVWHGFREIGNAVMPILAKELGDSVVSALFDQTPVFESLQLEVQPTRVLNFSMKDASQYWGVVDGIIPKRKRLISVLTAPDAGPASDPSINLGDIHIGSFDDIRSKEGRR
jgi:DNA (cytosine-5)-methyltransferase 1